MKTIEFDLYKGYKEEDYLNAAIKTAEWISKHEVKAKAGKYWKVSSSEGRYDELEQSFLGNRSLYSGAAGVGYFFLQLYEATRDEKWLQNAIDAAAYLLDDYDSKLAKKPGIHAGVAGEGLFFKFLYSITNNEIYRNQVLKIADDIYEQAVHENGTVHWYSYSDLMGDGGAILYWLYVAKLTGENKFTRYAKEAIDFVVNTKLEIDENTIYWKLFDPHKYFDKVPQGGVAPNFAHGTAGIVYLLTKYYELSKDDYYLELAHKGVNYLQSIAINTEDSTIIPYIYLEEKQQPYDVFYLGYCHGPVGDAITYKELYKVTGDERYLAIYRRMTKALINAGVPEKRTAGFWNNCICCGSAGVLLHFVDGISTVGEEVYVEYAKKTANKLVSDAYKDEDGLRWYNAWTRIKPWDVDAHIGLFTGAAGCGSSLLSLYGKLTGHKITPLLEFSDWE